MTESAQVRRFDVTVDFTVEGDDSDDAERRLAGALDNLGFDYSVTYVQDQP